jgi:glycine/D-amino acid oxidase-like deaminating enzyme
VRAVITTQGSMEADYIVLATGNDTTELAAKAGMYVPLKESKGILAHTAPQPELLKRVMMPPGADVKQNFDSRIVTGANFGDTGDAHPTMELGHQYLAAAARYFPQLRNPLAAVQAGATQAAIPWIATPAANRPRHRPRRAAGFR